MSAFAKLDDVSLSQPDGALLFSGLTLVIGEGATGRRDRRAGGAPKMLLDTRQQRAEVTAGQGRRLAERQGAEAQAAMTAARAEIERLRPMSFTLSPTGLPSGREVLSVIGLTIRLRNAPVIGPVSFSITGPDRVAISGPNGTEKSTILRAVAASGAGAGGAGAIHPICKAAGEAAQSQRRFLMAAATND